MKKFTLYSTAFLLFVVGLIHGAEPQSDRKDGKKGDKEGIRNGDNNSNKYWMDGIRVGPVTYSFEHRQTKTERLRSKSVYSGYATINQLGGGLTLKLSDIDQLIECNATLAPSQYDCKPLASHFISSGLEPPRINDQASEKSILSAEYVKVKRLKLKLKNNLLFAPWANGLTVEFLQYPVIGSEIVNEKQTASDSRYIEIRVYQPVQFICSGNIRQSRDVLFDISKTLKSINSVSSLLQFIGSLQNYTLNASEITCKHLDNSTSVSTPSIGIELVQSINLTLQQSCPRWKLTHVASLLPIREALDYHGLIEEHCNKENISNTTISIDLSYLGIPSINSRLDQVFIHDTVTNEGWEKMVLNNTLLLAFVNGHWSSGMYSKTLTVIPHLDTSVTPEIKYDSSGENHGEKNKLGPIIFEAKYDNDDRSGLVEFNFRLAKNHFSSMLTSVFHGSDVSSAESAAYKEDTPPSASAKDEL